MPRPRVLVVDDAVVVRRIVTQALEEDPGLEVVGTAPNGQVALAKIEQDTPDLVTLDVEMPVLDGLATLKALRREHPTLPVIMFSTLTERGAKVTMEALLHGANDYVTKPANVGSVQEAIERVRAELIPKIHALCGTASRPAAARQEPPPPSPRAVRVPPARTSGTTPRVDVVTIGVSTGGPNALAELLPALPPDLDVPVLIVQHMPATFTRLLAERLDSRGPLHVVEADQGVPVVPGDVVLARGDHHLRVRRTRAGVEAVLDQGPPENSCRPAVDVLFRSAAELYGAHVLAVVLTGMGTDGRNGCEHVRAAGGRVVVQDEASSVVWGMPGAVARAGLADAVVPLDRMGHEIGERVARSRRGTASAPVGGARP